MPRDRAPLRDFASAVEEQTRRLERLYENHLQQIANAVNVLNAAASRGACERIVGIRQLSVLHGQNAPEADQHVIAMKPPPGERWPEPALRERQTGLPRATLQLVESELLGDRADRAGWVDRPAQPLIYWKRRDWENVAIVFSLDRGEIAQTIDEWLRSWLASGASGVFAGVKTAGGPDRLLGTRGEALRAVGAEPAQPQRPDFLLPLRGRFGTWNFASWDRRETQRSYHTPTLFAAGALGLFTAALGCAVFIQQRRAAAEAAQRVSFVNRVSHELRTPLTNILLNLDLAMEALEDSAREPTRRLRIVHEEARRLARLIDNVLTFSRHEQGKLRLERHACVPAKILAAVLDQFAPSFERHALEVRRAGDLGTVCLLDADALAQILSNLLSNVEKYVPGGVLEINGALECGFLRITVSDQGPGIPPDAAERIFRAFERLGSGVNEGATGTGLGLAIARDLAVRMGGTLRLLPSTRGASFELHVPAPFAAPISAVSAA